MVRDAASGAAGVGLIGRQLRAWSGSGFWGRALVSGWLQEEVRLPVGACAVGDVRGRVTFLAIGHAGLGDCVTVLGGSRQRAGRRQGVVASSSRLFSTIKRWLTLRRAARSASVRWLAARAASRCFRSSSISASRSAGRPSPSRARHRVPGCVAHGAELAPRQGFAGGRRSVPGACGSRPPGRLPCGPMLPPRPVADRQQDGHVPRHAGIRPAPGRDGQQGEVAGRCRPR